VVTTHRADTLVRGALLGALLLVGRDAGAQQFNSDSFWVAPQGVATFTLTAGQEYSLGILTVALFPGWEFNLGVTHFVDNPLQLTEGHYSGVLYAKRRFYQNDDETAGFAVMAGTGVNPGHLELGTETDTFTSWWATGALTLPFRGGDVSLDLMPGFVFNRNQDRPGDAAWGMTWSARVAVYKIVPQCSIVGEVFGTTGEAYAEPQWKAGVRWEHMPRIVVAATYGRAFNGEPGARLEVGVSIFTDPFLCQKGCRK